MYLALLVSVKLHFVEKFMILKRLEALVNTLMVTNCSNKKLVECTSLRSSSETNPFELCEKSLKVNTYINFIDSWFYFLKPLKCSPNSSLSTEKLYNYELGEMLCLL